MPPCPLARAHSRHVEQVVSAQAMDSKRIMKRTFVCLLATFLLTGGLGAAAQPGVTEISASGTGSISLPPDIATILRWATTPSDTI